MPATPTTRQTRPAAPGGASHRTDRSAVGSKRGNKVRIIGGKWRGRKLQVAGDPVRPTPDRTRVTLFNWLVADLPGARVLDLFAGTGVLGFEALSRNAAHATLVERDPAACALLTRHRDMLDADATITRAEAINWLAKQPPGKRWDVVFLDPPFSSPLLPAAIAETARHLSAQGVVYAEFDASFHLAAAAYSAGLVVAKASKAGAVRYGLLRTPDGTRS